MQPTISHFDYKQKIQRHSPTVTTRASDYVVTYIAQALNAQCVEQLDTLLASYGHVESCYLHPLSEQLTSVGLVFEFSPNDLLQLDELRAKLADLAMRFAIDLALTESPPQLSKPGLLVMDMDSTMIQIECIDEIARLAGRYDDVAAVTAQAMQGKLDFAQSLQTRVACLKGVEESSLLSIKQRLPLMPGLVKLIAILRQYQWKLAIASGGFTYFADYLKDWLALDAAESNVLEWQNGCLTGKTLGDIVDAQYKADTLNKLQRDYAICETQTVAMGDGANDVLMMRQASLGVAFHAKPSVQPQADAAINDQALDALLLLLRL